MDSSYKWKKIQFGNIFLETFPPSSNLSFKTQHKLPEEQHCLLDNLWKTAFNNQRNFTAVMHALAGHFAYLNNQINYHPPSSPIQTLSLQPNTPERIKNLEREIEKIKTEKEGKEKENEKLMKKLEEMKGKQVINNHSQNNNKSSQECVLEKEKECFFVFPNKKPFSLDFHEKIQNILWSLEASPAAPAGLAFAVQIFNKDCCESCRKGFAIIKSSLELNFFKPFTFGGIQISTEILWNLGFLSRIIICSHEEIEQIPNGKLRHFLYCLFENEEFSFLDLEFEVLPGLGIDKTRYKIKVALQQQAAPVQRRTGLNHLKRTSPINEQIVLWRNTLLAIFPRMTPHLPLAFEDDQVKVYCTMDTYYVPFDQIIVDNPDSVEHMKYTHANLSLHQIGDYGHYALPLRELLDSPLLSSPGDPAGNDYFDDLDSIGLANLENAMEK